MAPLDLAPDRLPARFADWFAGRGWAPHAHQLDMLAAAGRGDHALLIAPTGGGKTLAGFLPSLIDLAENPVTGLHTLYVSPLKALAVDIARNLDAPVREMGLAITCETRTGDTPNHKRQRQRQKPPNILMTTPESLALLLSYADAPRMFRTLRCLVVDELHSFAPTKRGDLLALAMSRVQALAPGCRRVGLSATVHDEAGFRDWLAPGNQRGGGEGAAVAVVHGAPAPDPVIEVTAPSARIPWSGHMALHNLPEVYRAIAEHGTTIVFVNTRAQAELVFRGLWRLNDAALPIGVHHGSLVKEQRRKVEAAMARGELRAVVATSSLDLGIDWGDVDLVLQLGAPKGASRLVQRIGRANHRYDEPSRAILFPGNRFEFLESWAAREAVAEMDLDGEPLRPGALDVLAQHILSTACGTAFRAGDLYRQVRTAAPYARLPRKTFDEVLNFVATGGYALGTYERYKRLARDSDGAWRVANQRVARQYRMNSGVIVDAEQLAVRLGRGRKLGHVEEYFAMGLEPGDTFIFAGQLLEFQHIHEMSIIARKAKAGGEPKVPAYGGARMPLTTLLADRVRAALADPGGWKKYPLEVREWLLKQQEVSELPGADGLLVESFPRGVGTAVRHFTVAYCFEGRNAHQTLGMLLTKRMLRAGLHPLGFVATDYVIAVWSLNPVEDVDALFHQNMLGDDLEEWMAESSMLRRHFRNVAIITGIIERRYPGAEKTGRQITFSSDLIYDVLRKHEPNHILLRATRADAATGLTDIRRLGEMLTRVQGRIRHRVLDRISPLAVPVLLEIGRESVMNASMDELLAREADLVAEAGFDR